MIRSSHVVVSRLEHTSLSRPSLPCNTCAVQFSNLLLVFSTSQFRSRSAIPPLPFSFILPSHTKAEVGRRALARVSCLPFDPGENIEPPRLWTSHLGHSLRRVTKGRGAHADARLHESSLPCDPTFPSLRARRRLHSPMNWSLLVLRLQPFFHL